MSLTHLNSSKAELTLSFQPSLILTPKSAIILLNGKIIKDNLVFIFSLQYTHKSENKLFLSPVSNRPRFSFKKL